MNSASRLLDGEKPATILSPAHDHERGEEGLFTKGSVVNVFCESESEGGARRD